MKKGEKEILTERLKQVKDAYYGMCSMSDSLPRKVSGEKIQVDQTNESKTVYRLS